MSSSRASNEPLGTRKPLSKKLIICCDGTWKSFSITNILAIFRKSAQLPTNITRITRAIQNNDTRSSSPTYNHSQIVFYQAGVGSSGTLSNRLLEGAIGSGLAENIREAYAFIAANYVDGDEVFLIGYSRGAYTARAVGGLIGDVGLLKKEAMDMFSDVYADWNSAGKKDYKPLLAAPPSSSFPPSQNIQSFLANYRDYLCKAGYTTPKPVIITAIGVFETVGALGIPTLPLLQRLGLPYAFQRYHFYDTSLTSSGHVLNAFQALALDEHRSVFRPTVWERLPGVKTNLKQTWFPGSHGDVGGGYADVGLANITLAWMMSQLSPWIDFHPDYIKKQHEENLKYLEMEKVQRTALQWAASQLHDTATGIIGWSGAWRTPGRYHRVDSMTGRTVAKQMLRDTNERIHMSVRSRESTGGLDGRNKVAPYRAKALSGYVLENPDAELGKGVWKYEGQDSASPGTQLSEDELGSFEYELYRQSSKWSGNE